MDHEKAKKTVRTFSFATFLNDMGSDMITPIWPLFVTSVLGANMAVLGLIDGLGDAFVSISQAVSGYLSDRIRKRKIFVWLGYLCAAFSRIGYALTTIWQQLIPLRILDRFGKMRDAPRDAIMADISPRRERGGNFGFLRMMDYLGSVFGVIICILFFETLGYRNLFLIAAVPSLLGVLLVLFLIKEKKPIAKIHHGLSFKSLSRNLKLFLLLSAVFAAGAFSYSFLLIYAKKLGVATGFIPALYLIFSATASAASIPFGKLADRIGRKWVMMMAYMLWGITCLCFIFIKSPFAAVIPFVFYGLHKGVLDPVQKTFVSELAPTEYRASVLGGFQMVIGLCAFPASLFAGILWETVGIEAPFYVSLGLTVLAIGLLAFVKEKLPPELKI